MNPPLDAFARALTQPGMSVQKLSTARKFNCDTKEKLLDRMLLALHDALFLDQSMHWSARHVSNTHASETLELARYFLRGLAVGDKLMFDGMCAMCASLLVAGSQSSGLNNRR